MNDIFPVTETEKTLPLEKSPLIRITKEILSLLPPHRTFIDMLGSDFQIEVAKIPSHVETYNDVNKIIFDFTHTFIEENKYNEFLEYLDGKWDGLKYHDEKTIQKNYFYYRIWSSVYDEFKNKVKDQFELKTHVWLSKLGEFHNVYNKLLRIQYENQDIEKLSFRYDRKETLFYYDIDTKKDDVGKILSIAEKVQGKVFILAEFSGASIYEEREKFNHLKEKGWDFKEVFSHTTSDKKNKKHGIMSAVMPNYHHHVRTVIRNPQSLINQSFI